ncbi:MAG: endo-1,4-beta-xylanase, partial [Candidatus Nanohaloarchaea archaeon]|nr:endo-1,4-beta-xylanase [Candidatus Nanohaloarchaea archaeon]
LDAGIETITLWGVKDDRSWITVWRDYPEKYTQRPLLFDSDGNRKKSYKEVKQVLQNFEGSKV